MKLKIIHRLRASQEVHLDFKFLIQNCEQKIKSLKNSSFKILL